MSRRNTKPTPINVAASKESQEIAVLNSALLHTQERLLELEQELSGYQQLSGGAEGWEFSRRALRDIHKISKFLYLKNPLIRRTVQIGIIYVWGLGFTVKSKDEDVQKVINKFMRDPRNKPVVSSSKALEEREEDQATTGNQFYLHYINRQSGRVRLRVLDVDEISDIILNPDDSQDPWFYRRDYTEGTKQVTVYYPDIRWLSVCLGRVDPPQLPDTVTKQLVDNSTIEWTIPVRHKKTGGLSTMRFGLPEAFSAHAWAGAVKTFLEDWSTIMRAYARIAMQVSQVGSKKNVAAAKDKLQVGGFGTGIATGPNSATGGFAIFGGGSEIKSVKTAGSTTAASESYELKMMVASGSGYPGHFFGDADVGNYATSTTLDRPTELKIRLRQNFWVETFREWIEVALIASAYSPNGTLRSAGYSVEWDYDESENSYSPILMNGREEADIQELVSVVFPDILERNATERVRAMVGALTLNGDLPTDLLPDRRLATKLLLTSIGELDPKEIEDTLNEMYPEGTKPAPIPPPQQVQMDLAKLQNQNKSKPGGMGLGADNNQPGGGRGQK